MKAISATVTVISLLLLLSGCYEVEQSFTINPDGSGKVDVKAQIASTYMSGETTPDVRIRKQVSDILSLSKGVAAWKDVHFEWTKDALISFSGTAYFDDVSKLDLDALQVFRVRWVPLGESRYRLLIEAATEGEENDRRGPAKMSPEELEKEIIRRRTAYRQDRPVMAAMASKARIGLAFDLPGTVESLENMKSLEGADASFSLAYEDAAKAMDELVASDDWVRKQILSGRGLSQQGSLEDEALREKLFGRPGPIAAVVRSDGRPCFEYASEAATAKRDYEGMLEATGLKPWFPSPVSKGLVSARLAGTRFVGPGNDSPTWKPFGAPPGCVIALVAEFDGSFVEILGGEVQSAVADTGESLLPSEKSKRGIILPYYANDKRTKLLFYVGLQPPGPRSLGLSELSGVLRYTRATAVRKIDLGFGELNEGAEGKELNARVTSVGTTEKFGHGKLDVLTLSISVPKREVSALIVQDASGKEAWVPYGADASADGRGTVVYVARNLLPKDARLAVAVWQDITTHETVFEVRDASWRCVPLE